MAKTRKQRIGVRERNRPSTKMRKGNGRLGLAAKRRTPRARKGNQRGTAVAQSRRGLATQSVVGGMDSGEIEMEEYTDISEETASILSLVKGLEGQVDTAFKLKEAFEADLDSARRKLSEESVARAELETRVELLETKAALADQLRGDVSFAEEERNKLADLLAQTQPQLETVTQDRDSLAEKMAEIEARADAVEDEKTTLEAQTMNLKDKVADMDRLRDEIAALADTRRELEGKVADLSSRLEASDTSSNALEANLAQTNKAGDAVREEMENLRERLMGADERLSSLRSELEQQQAVNSDLMETNTRLESELKMVNINYEGSKSELDTVKKALRDIRIEAVRVSGRVRQRYFKTKEGAAG